MPGTMSATGARRGARSAGSTGAGATGVGSGVISGRGCRITPVATVFNTDHQLRKSGIPPPDGPAASRE